MESKDPFHLQLEIQHTDDPIEGSLRSGHEEPVPFVGWLELIAAIESARAGDHDPLADNEEPDGRGE